jgi:hypothetical protein
MHWSLNDMEEEGTLTIGESLVISVVKLVWWCINDISLSVGLFSIQSPSMSTSCQKNKRIWLLIMLSYSGSLVVLGVAMLISLFVHSLSPMSLFFKLKWYLSSKASILVKVTSNRVHTYSI